MAIHHVELTVRAFLGHTDSVDDQVSILIEMDHHGISTPDSGIRRNAIEGVLGLSLDYRPGTSLDHLVEKGFVARTPEEYEDLGTFAIAEWLGSDGEIVNGRVDEVAEDAIEALIDHVHETDPSAPPGDAVADGSGLPLRDILADEFGIAPSELEDRLRSGDLVLNLREAVNAIEDHPLLTTANEYGSIQFRNEAYRYYLSDQAQELFRL